MLLLIAANFTFKHRYGRSFEEMMGVPGPSGGPGGVTPDSYWKERYEDMQSQLDEFNKLKEQEDEGKEQEDLRAQKIVDNPGVDLENQTNPYTVSNVSVNYGEHPVTSDYNLLTAGYSLDEIEEQKQKRRTSNSSVSVLVLISISMNGNFVLFLFVFLVTLGT